MIDKFFGVAANRYPNHASAHIASHSIKLVLEAFEHVSLDLQKLL